MATQVAPLASERIIINAPMSFAGATQRSWRLRERAPSGPVRWLAIAGIFCLIALWWVAVAGWYLVFGILLVPYRLLRRGSRKRKAEALRHREAMAAIQEQRRP